MIATLLESPEIAPNVRHFVFQVEDAESFSYVPGQWVSLTAEIDGAPITRAYSIASPPNGRLFELCLNEVIEGRFSPYLFDLRPGAQIQFKGPYGSFIFRQPVEDSVLVATGTGIVPFRAMLHRQLARDSSHTFTLMFGARHEHGLLYPGPEWEGRTGRVQEHLFEAIGERRDINVFICGLKAMVDDVRAILKSAGFDRKRIIYEKYD